MTKIKLLSKLFLSTIILIPSVADSTNSTEIKIANNEFFMSYKSNGKSYSLDQVELKLFSHDIRYSITGSSSIQGDINVVTIRYLGNRAISMGTFDTSERSAAFILGGDDGVSSSLDLAKGSFGTGTYTISELTDTYVKGSFNFVAYSSAEDTPKKKYNITKGLFKAKIMKY